MKLTHIAAILALAGSAPVLAQTNMNSPSSPMMEGAGALDDRGTLTSGSGSVGAASSVSNNAQFSNNAAGIRQIQEQLNQRGYPVAVDGRMGAQTRTAVQNFQLSQGLSVNGNLDSRTLGALGIGAQGSVNAGSGSVGASTYPNNTTPPGYPNSNPATPSTYPNNSSAGPSGFPNNNSNTGQSNIGGSGQGGISTGTGIGASGRAGGSAGAGAR